MVAQTIAVSLLGRHRRTASDLPSAEKPVRRRDMHAIDEGEHAGRRVEVSGARQNKLREGLQDLCQGTLGRQQALRGSKITRPAWQRDGGEVWVSEVEIAAGNHAPMHGIQERPL